jgi:hypothetical protein
MLRCINSTYISDDDDEVNDKPAEAAKRELIRRHETRRSTERKKADTEAKDSVVAPSESFSNNRKLSNHHDCFAVMIFLMDIEDMVQRKEWNSPTELRVFRQNEKRYKAHTAFHNHIKSGHDLYLIVDKR